MKRVVIMMAAAAMLFGACCTKQCDTPNTAGVVMDRNPVCQIIKSYQTAINNINPFQIQEMLHATSLQIFNL